MAATVTAPIASLAEVKSFSLFPPIEPFATGELKVDEHTLYYEQVGSQAADAKPIIVLHGGPGSGCYPSHRQLFDPAIWRVILLDQRGAGKSRPLGCVTNNTTAHLIADIELLREKLGIAKWIVYGGSWGSTLALAYAQKHPTVCKALIVYGIYTGSQKENDTFQRDAYPQQWPEELELVRANIPAVEQVDLTSAYYRRLVAPGPAAYKLTDEQTVHLAASWLRFESVGSQLRPDPTAIYNDYVKNGSDTVAKARIECHYFVHGCFFDRQEQVIEDAKILKEHKIPGVIIHGRYDLVCQPRLAYALHRVWGSELTTLTFTMASHGAKEPETLPHLLAAVDKFKSL